MVQTDPFSTIRHPGIGFSKPTLGALNQHRAPAEQQDSRQPSISQRRSVRRNRAQFSLLAAMAANSRAPSR